MSNLQSMAMMAHRYGTVLAVGKNPKMVQVDLTRGLVRACV